MVLLFLLFNCLLVLTLFVVRVFLALQALHAILSLRLFLIMMNALQRSPLSPTTNTTFEPRGAFFI